MISAVELLEVYGLIGALPIRSSQYSARSNPRNIKILRLHPDLARIIMVIILVFSLTLPVANVRAEPLWLEGWRKRVELLIDHADIDESLIHFPVLIYLGNTSGRYSEDATFIFDELQDNVNRKKIAVTTNDGVTECYVEIEAWNQTNEQAWLWVNVPNIDSVNDTVLFLYYDVNQTDNANYIGDAGSIPAENVWDEYYTLVCHLRDDPDSSHVRDSTSNSYDGTKGGAGEPTVTSSGNIDGVQDFDGNDYVNHGNSFSQTTNFTVSAWVKPNTGTGSDDQIVSKGYDGTNTQWEFKTTSSDLKVSFRAWSGSATGVQSLSNMVSGSWYHLVGTYDGTTWSIYWNGTLDASNDDVGPIETTNDNVIGAVQTTSGYTQYWNGLIDEVRVSSTVRTAAWIKASYESGRDDLLAFGSEETQPQQIVGGEIVHPNPIELVAPYIFILIIVFSTGLLYKKRMRVLV